MAHGVDRFATSALPTFNALPSNSRASASRRASSPSKTDDTGNAGLGQCAGLPDRYYCVGAV